MTIGCGVEGQGLTVRALQFCERGETSSFFKRFVLIYTLEELKHLFIVSIRMSQHVMKHRHPRIFAFAESQLSATTNAVPKECHIAWKTPTSGFELLPVAVNW